MKQQSEKKIFEVISKIGRLLLENGSEIEIINEKIDELAQNFGYKTQCFLTLSSIVITFQKENELPLTLTKRVRYRTVNLDKVCQLFSLIERGWNYKIEEIEKKIETIEDSNGYPFLLKLMGFSLGAASFTILFSGKPNEFIATFISGLSIGITLHLSHLLKLKRFFCDLLAAFFGTFIIYFFKSVGLIPDEKIALISALMLLVPGVPFVNTIRDILAGNLVVGAAKFSEVVMIGTAIATGAVMAIRIF